LTIRFQDLDARLLASPEETALETPFPRALDHLTIDISAIISDSALTNHLPPLVSLTGSAQISHVELARDSLDCVVSLSSGEVFVFKLPSSLDRETFSNKPEASEELITLDDNILSNMSRYRPLLLVNAQRGPVSALSISDIGMTEFCIFRYLPSEMLL
jgi:hypothetical protein